MWAQSHVANRIAFIEVFTGWRRAIGQSDAMINLTLGLWLAFEDL